MAAHIQAAVNHEIGVPACNGCGSPESVAPSVHTYRGPYFCIRCCNYLDKAGRLAG